MIVFLVVLRIHSDDRNSFEDFEDPRIEWDIQLSLKIPAFPACDGLKIKNEFEDSLQS